MNRKTRLTAAAMTIVATALTASLTGCGSSDLVTDESEANPDVVAEKFVGSEALLRPSEFPKGWSPTEASTEAPVPEVAAVRQVVDKCSGVDISYQRGFARSLVFGDVFSDGAGAWIEQTLAIDNVIAIDGIMNTFSADRAPECFSAQFAAAMQTEADESNAESGAEVGSVETDRVPMGEVGEASIGYRISAMVESSEGATVVYVDLRFVRVGDTISVLAARSDSGQEVDTADLDQLVETSVERLPVDVN